MTIVLTDDQQAWIAEHVARGNFSTVEEAARQLIDERIAEREADAHDDLSWAKPAVDKALAEIERGESLTFGEHEARMGRLLASLIV